MRPLGVLLVATAATAAISASPMHTADSRVSLTSLSGVIHGIQQAPRIPATLGEMWNHGYDSFRQQMKAHEASP